MSTSAVTEGPPGRPRPGVFESDHETFRRTVRDFFTQEVVPDYAAWEAEGRPPRWFWRRAGALGLLGIGVPVEYGGLPGSTFRHSAIVTEEAQYAGLALGGLRVHVDICMPYLLEYATDEQKARWLPRLTSGEAVAALALSEPGAGSDLKALATRARREDGDYVIDGAKTFISNGLGADLVIVAAKTDPKAGRRGISLFVVDARTEGFQRGSRLEKMGQKAQDLAELFFADMRVPAEDLLGEENAGFGYLTANLAQERLSIALNSQAAAAAALDTTVRAVRSLGGVIGQHTKFELADCETRVAAGQALADRALLALEDHSLTPADAATVKLFCTELQGYVVERCVELCGLDACVRDSTLGRAYTDARVSRIYGGSSEIMKVIVAKSLGL